jgi:hypothetical protein
MPEFPDPPDQAAAVDGDDCMTPQQQRLESKGTTGLGATRRARPARLQSVTRGSAAENRAP